MAYWGYNEGGNDPPHKHEPLAHDATDPDRLRQMSWLQRYLAAALFLGVVFAIALIAKYT